MMDALFDILKKIQNKNPALRQRIREATAMDRWTVVVGPHIARHTRAIKVHEGILWVEVDHPIWKSELHHRRRQILDLLNQDLKTQNNPASQLSAGPVPQSTSAATPVIQDLLLLDPRGENVKKPLFQAFGKKPPSQP
jgi:hypothetical protein